MYKNFLIILCCISAFLGGCSTKIKTQEEPKDLLLIEQSLSKHLHEIVSFSAEQKEYLYKDFLAKYFKPWKIDKVSYSYEIATWAFEYQNKEVYGENHIKISQKWFDEIIDNSNFEYFNTNLQKAITITNSHLRSLPTQSAIFYNLKKAGEGFPFDYNQNSSIKPNIPLLISHYSKDKLWAFVESNLALGWIRIQDIAIVDDDFMNMFMSDDYYVSTHDDVIIEYQQNIVDKIELATILPKRNQKLLFAQKDSNGKAILIEIDANKNLQKLPLGFEMDNISMIGNQLIGQRYGWGGLYGHRDCSAMLRDFYMPFGIFLQRNSADQKKDGIVHEISHLSNQDKKDFIVNNGIPFLTIVYLRGHTMIYIGHVDKEPMVFHNVWGIRTLENDGSIGRYVVGRAVVSTLELGKDLPDSIKDALLIDRVESITLIAVQ